MDKSSLLSFELIRVCAEIVPLGLNHIRRQLLRPIAIVERYCTRESRNRHSSGYGHGDNLPEGGYRLLEDRGEVGVEQEVFEAGVLTECLVDITQECTPDDASSTPHEEGL